MNILEFILSLNQKETLDCDNSFVPIISMNSEIVINTQQTYISLLNIESTRMT